MTTLPLYRQAFPDFVLGVTLPEGFEDTSWKDDACPSFTRTVGDYDIRLYINYTDPSRRECPDMSHFSAVVSHKGDCDSVLEFCSDDWVEMTNWTRLMATALGMMAKSL